MGLEEGLDKLKNGIEGELKKAEGEVVDKSKTAALEEAVKTLAKNGIATDDILTQIQAKFTDIDVDKIKEVISKVLKKQEKKEEKAEEKSEKKEEKEEKKAE